MRNRKLFNNIVLVRPHPLGKMIYRKDLSVEFCNDVFNFSLTLFRQQEIKIFKSRGLLIKIENQRMDIKYKEKVYSNDNKVVIPDVCLISLTEKSSVIHFDDQVFLIEFIHTFNIGFYMVLYDLNDNESYYLDVQGRLFPSGAKTIYEAYNQKLPFMPELPSLFKRWSQ